MPDATFTTPDLTTFTGLNGLGLEVTGQLIEPEGGYQCISRANESPPLSRGRTVRSCRAERDPHRRGRDHR